MRVIQETIFVLMIIVGLFMIVYDVINARTAARTLSSRTLRRNKVVSQLRIGTAMDLNRAANHVVRGGQQWNMN